MNSPKNPKPCTFPGCPRDLRAHGLCSGHLRQRNVGRELAPLGTYLGGDRRSAAAKAEKAAAGARPKPSMSDAKVRRLLPMGQRVWLVDGDTRQYLQVIGYRDDIALLGEVEA